MGKWYLLKYNITNEYTRKQSFLVYSTMLLCMMAIGVVNWYAQKLNVHCEQKEMPNFDPEAGCQPRIFNAGERLQGSIFSFTFLDTAEYRGEPLVCTPSRANLWVRGIPASNPFQEFDYTMNCNNGSIALAVQGCNDDTARKRIMVAFGNVMLLQCGDAPVNTFSLVDGRNYVYSNNNYITCRRDDLQELTDLYSYLNATIQLDLKATVPSPNYACEKCVHNYFDISVLFKLIVSVFAFITPLRFVILYVLDKYYHVHHNLKHNIENHQVKKILNEV
ncbi:MAG: hypothetical protein J3Q66DRAFT_363231 [Benniella sp.]|nr:MAG: hypothetical protein J3Q66DRAFT_363231 [Benniella sp.]